MRAITLAERKQLYERDNGTCGICGLPLGYKGMHIDHKVPLSRGGSDEWDNLQIAHAACNIRKGNATENEPLSTNPVVRDRDGKDSSLRIPLALYEWLKAEAARERRSLHGQILHLLYRAKDDNK